MENIELDVHTHTIASGHAYSSLSEMVAGAKYLFLFENINLQKHFAINL